MRLLFYRVPYRCSRRDILDGGTWERSTSAPLQHAVSTKNVDDSSRFGGAEMSRTGTLPKPASSAAVPSQWRQTVVCVRGARGALFRKGSIPQLKFYLHRSGLVSSHLCCYCQEPENIDHFDLPAVFLPFTKQFISKFY